MDLNISSEQIEKYIADKVIESSLGDLVKQGVKEVFTAKENAWENKTIIEKAVAQQVRNVVLRYVIEIINNEKDYIREQVSNHLTDDMIKEFVSDCVSNRFENSQG